MAGKEINAWDHKVSTLCQTYCRSDANSTKGVFDCRHVDGRDETWIHTLYKSPSSCRQFSIILIHLLQLHDSKNEVGSSLQQFLDVEVTVLSANDDDESDVTVNTCWYLHARKPPAPLLLKTGDYTQLLLCVSQGEYSLHVWSEHNTIELSNI